MLDFLRFCRENGIPYLTEGHPHCRNGWAQVQCPQCGAGGSHGGWYLGFALEGGTFNCWRCGKLDFWVAVGGLLRLQDKQLLREIVGKYQREGQRSVRIEKVRKRELTPPPGATALLPAHRRYLAGRNYDPDTLVRDWGLLGTGPLSGRWNWRVIIPIRWDGRVVAYQGRSIGGAEPKYRATDDADWLVDPKSILYGMEKVPGDTVLVVEGVTGVWRLGPGTVATLGIDWKAKQVAALRHYRNRFILFDPEPKAQQRAMQLAVELSAFPGNTEVLDGFSTDPGDFSPARAVKIRRVIGL